MKLLSLLNKFVINITSVKVM